MSFVDRLSNVKILPGKNKFFRCSSGKTEASINPYGELKLCPEINQPTYDILGIGLDKAWGQLKKYVKKLEEPFPVTFGKGVYSFHDEEGEKIRKEYTFPVEDKE